ncbi:hypothetical protein COOONC_13042 [Cooperia oncophora]
MVSIDHMNAEFYFNRDVECVRTFFKRKFDYDCDEYPKFSDIERKYNLDVELEASGFTKQMDIDLNKAYDSGNFNAHVNTADFVESGEDDDEEESETEESNSEPENDTIPEEDVDHEEIRQEEEFRKNEAKMLSNPSGLRTGWERLPHNWTSSSWKKAVRLGDECPLLVHHREIERETEHRPEREAYIRAREELDRRETEASELEQPGRAS